MDAKLTDCIENLLTCVNARANCVHQGTAIGCCISSQISDCTNIPSSCVNYDDPCDAACKSNTRILKCDTTTEPYCGTYFFGGGSRLFGCRSYASVTSQVQQLTDYYASVYGSEWRTRLTADSTTTSFELPSPTDDPEPTDDISVPGPSPTDSPSPSPTPTDPVDDDKDSSLGTGAIAGIVVGACAGVGAIAAFLVWFFCVKKKRDNNAAAAAQQAPLMQGGGPPPPPPAGPGPHAGHDPHASQYGPPAGGAAGSYYAPPQENKPGVGVDGTQPPSYGYDNKPPHQQPVMAEMPGSGLAPAGQTTDPYNRMSMGPPSPLSGGSTSPNSPNLNAVGGGAPMHSTHAGPVPEQIYEMGPGR